MKKPVIIGVGGPVGSGKTLLIERITRLAKDEYKFAVITNDIYTKEDAKFLVKNSVLSEDRVIGVETGGCPHTAIREDASMNFAAIEEMKSRFNDLDIIFLESGGDNFIRPSNLFSLITVFSFFFSNTISNSPAYLLLLILINSF